MPLNFRIRFQDWAMKWMDELRPDTVGQAKGNVLEVGFGTGLNLPFYSNDVNSLTALDPMKDWPAFVSDRVDAVSFPVEFHARRADRELPFSSGQFDSIVSTWTLCTIPDPVAALREMKRVLLPGGKYFFIEHGESESCRVSRWQHRIDPAWCRIADGCHLNRSILDLVMEAGFQVESHSRFRGRGPEILSALIRGVAH